MYIVKNTEIYSFIIFMSSVTEPKSEDKSKKELFLSFTLRLFKHLHVHQFVTVTACFSRLKCLPCSHTDAHEPLGMMGMMGGEQDIC